MKKTPNKIIAKSAQNSQIIVKPRQSSRAIKKIGEKVEEQSSAGEVLYYGHYACQALYRYRKADIIRAYVIEEKVADMALVLKWCALNKKAYHVVSKEDLGKITASVHHEGVAILAKRKPLLEEQELYAVLGKGLQPLVVLDGVQNPHNVGSIMRVMAHFGWKYLVANQAHSFQISASAARMSEGGSEVVSLSFFQDEARFIDRLKALGYHLMGSSSHAKKSLYSTKLVYPGLAFFLGNEVHGISRSLLQKLDVVLSLPNSGDVQSLNVAMTSALLIGESVRQHGLAK